MEQQYEYAIAGRNELGEMRSDILISRERGAVVVEQWRKAGLTNVRIVRRPVGEWEDVPDA